MAYLSARLTLTGKVPLAPRLLGASVRMLMYHWKYNEMEKIIIYENSSRAVAGLERIF